MIDVLEYCVSKVAKVFTKSLDMVLLRIEGVLNVATHLYEVHGVPASIRCHTQNICEGSILCLLVEKNLRDRWFFLERIVEEAIFGKVVQNYPRTREKEGEYPLLDQEHLEGSSRAVIVFVDTLVTVF